MALTLAACICATLVQVAGWNTLPSYYFFKANLTDLNVQGTAGGNQLLTEAIGELIGELKTAQGIDNIYNIHLWNYCSTKNANGSDLKCSPRTSNFAFDPVEVWGLASDGKATSTSSADNAAEKAINRVEDSIDDKEDELLGKSGQKALDAYKKVAKWMFIGYQVAFWVNLATIFVGVAAVFSRWGSLVTWIFSLVTSVFTVAANLTATVLFATVTEALKDVLKPYNIRLTLGERVYIVGWLGAAFSVGATLFWLFSVCCCSGRSNPHHKDKKGGLWNAEPKIPDYGDEHAMKVEQAGGAYERVESPYVSGHDNVPMQTYQKPAEPYPTGQQNGYEPYRHA
jgi:hypothetical protein